MGSGERVIEKCNAQPAGAMLCVAMQASALNAQRQHPIQNKVSGISPAFA
jgi:hypothetical protein